MNISSRLLSISLTLENIDQTTLEVSEPLTISLDTDQISALLYSSEISHGISRFLSNVLCPIFMEAHKHGIPTKVESPFDDSVALQFDSFAQAATNGMLGAHLINKVYEIVGILIKHAPVPALPTLIPVLEAIEPLLPLFRARFDALPPHLKAVPDTLDSFTLHRATKNLERAKADPNTTPEQLQLLEDAVATMTTTIEAVTQPTNPSEPPADGTTPN